MAKVGAGMLGTGRALLAGLGGRPMREPFQRGLKRRGFDSLLFANPEILAGTLDVVDSVAAHDAFHLSCEAKFGEPEGAGFSLRLPEGGVSGKAFRVAYPCMGGDGETQRRVRAP